MKYQVSKELLSKELLDLCTQDEKHGELVAQISEHLPEIRKSTTYFGKTQSMFMDNVLTLSHPTTLRNIRQLLAQIEKASNALREVYFKTEKKKIKIRMKRRDLDLETDELKQELMGVEIDELLSQQQATQIYISGSVRKISNYVEQYKSLLKEHGKTEFNEKDFEEEEEKYHIMTAFNQGITAARSNGGKIDEGNHIYLNQIGINGAVAQMCVSDLLKKENELIKEGKFPTHEVVTGFLNQMVENFKGCSTLVMKGRGTNKSEFALLE